jgi:hypothetical protein
MADFSAIFIERFINKNHLLIYNKVRDNMVKKKRKTTSGTAPFRQMAGTVYGGAMVGSMTPLLSDASIGSGNLAGAAGTMFGVAMTAPMAGVAFDAIDNIYKSGKKK